ncbi:MAG: hypothetical protein FJ276_18785 [Planctomycetes bacterium]|nr:hypothetical protein [Planctomycetota bacterium]
MSAAREERGDPNVGGAGRAAAWETLMILGLFFLYAGCPPPDVNEAHYLAKAKHYWDPQWCASDGFLESTDAHTVFYWTFGWLTRWLALPAVAWVGRMVTWSLLAWAWQRLSYAIVPRRNVSVLTAGLFLLFLDRCHLAGEWVVGGVEAKGFAYVLVFCGLRSLVRGEWRAVWIWLGMSSAFHVLVGGWSVVAAAVAWLMSGPSRTPLRLMIPSLIGGFALALAGLLPAVDLTLGVDAETTQQANVIYVYGRLGHHLAPGQFALDRILWFGLLVMIWAVLWWRLRPAPPPWAGLNRFAVGTLVIATAGVLVDVLLRSRPGIAAELLRFYWFRASDMALPTVTAIGIPTLLVLWQGSHPRRARGGWWACAAASAAFVLAVYAGHLDDFRPRAEVQARPVSRGNKAAAEARYRAWRDACAWIAVHTDPDDRFLTPRDQQTFKWHAGRAEVVSWKDIPQDAAGIVRWWRLLEELHPPLASGSGIAAWSDSQLAEIAQRHHVDYILVDQTRVFRNLRFQRVYPVTSRARPYFVLYRVPEVTKEEEGDARRGRRRP